MAEAVGFEPTVRCRTLVFKTSAFDHSATLPIYGRSTRIRTLDLCIPNAAHYQTVLYSVIWHRCRESNPGFQFWRLTCYRNTSPTFFYEYTPSLSDLLLSAIHIAECTHKKSP